ncbi:unnamed protein product [Anisakis simplex]|uniref:Phosphoglycerate mutase family protein n=1 Tax=Anisakis simplex TaxID=6269 RepID=A0A0M3JUD7_ANISI|nr:unnamed protein product [Anisakis simplex]
MAPHPTASTIDSRGTRTVWVVRHGQRVDNIDKTWKLNAPRGAWDDPPLTSRGHQQAIECARRLARERIDTILCSPFMRCVQTASHISSVHPKQPRVFIEPGLCESLNVCQNPPGYLTATQLRNDFPLIDENYRTIVPKPEPENNEIECKQRITIVLNEMLRRYEGDILIVSHGSPIAMIHEVLTGEWHYIGQCTISKFISSGNDNNNGEMGTFSAAMQGDSTHLTDRTNLREREIQRPKL